MKDRIKKELFFCLSLIVAFLPMLVFLELAMEIQIMRDYGVLHALWFSTGMVFFSEIYSRL